jgi:hypothetical protein
MKMLIAFACSFLFLAQAHAETITLDQTACTATSICYAVQNSANAEIDYIDYSSHYERLTVSMGGVMYDSGLWMVKSLANVALYSPGGAVIYVTVSFSTVQGKCVQSGRVAVCPITITLTSGSIQE